MIVCEQLRARLNNVGVDFLGLDFGVRVRQVRKHDMQDFHEVVPAELCGQPRIRHLAHELGKDLDLVAIVLFPERQQQLGELVRRTHLAGDTVFLWLFRKSGETGWIRCLLHKI